VSYSEVFLYTIVLHEHLS